MMQQLEKWSCPICKDFILWGDNKALIAAHKKACLEKDISVTGYHKRLIERGVFGQISKIKEELQELEDAAERGIRVMVGCELSDLFGALREYADRQGFTIEDLQKMADVSKQVFESGYRKPRGEE